MIARAVGPVGSGADSSHSAVATNDAVNEWVVGGLGLSAAGCVQDGIICGLPPAFGGCTATAAAPTLSRLEHAVATYVGDRLSRRFAQRVTMAKDRRTFLVNDGEPAHTEIRQARG